MANIVTRTMALPIAEILEDGTKKNFYNDLRCMLDHCRVAYNYSVSLCAVQDNLHSSNTILDEKKIPKLNKTYNYDKIGFLFPEASAIAASIDRMATSKYREVRFDVLRGKKTIPTQRTCPLPLLHNKSTKTFSLELDEQNNIIATIQLLYGKKYIVRLRGGSNYKYILDRVRFCIETESYGDSKIWINKKNVATIGIACKIESKTQTNPTKKMKVVLGRNVFISCVKPHSNIPFNITGDQVKKWQSERRRKQERLRQDRKSGIARKTIKELQNKVSIKFQNRLKTFINQTTTHIVEHAKRNKVTKVEYDATIRSYFGGEFPYFEFAKMLEDKCVLQGIDFESITNEIIPAEENDPHVYFMMSIVNGKPDGKVKIGKTTQSKGKRKRNLETSGGFDLVILTTDKQPQSKLTTRERHYHAIFEKSRIEGTKEWFKLKDVLKYLKETNALGNCNNLTEIQQYIKV